MKRTLSVSAIKNGTVIDHIKVGQALKIVRILGLAKKGARVTVGLNLKSNLLNLKDLIKIEDKELSQDEANHVALFSPQATINLIRNYALVKKVPIHAPKTIKNLLTCPNRNCVTNLEKCSSFFYLQEWKESTLLRCKYCEKTYMREEIKE